MAGAVMPMRLRLNVTIRPAPKDAHGLEGRLGKHTPQLMAWAKRDADNAKLLITSPAAAATKAKLPLAVLDRRALERATTAADTTAVLPAGVKLVGFDVKLANEPKDRSPVLAAPKPTRPKTKQTKAKAKPKTKTNAKRGARRG